MAWSWIRYLELLWSISAEPYISPWMVEFLVRKFDEVHLDLPLDDLVKEMAEERMGILIRAIEMYPVPQ